MDDSEPQEGTYPSPGPPKEPPSASEAEAEKPEDSGASFVQVDTNAIVSDPSTRYFLIKSFSHDNIGRSLQHSVWATSQRNERVLAAAYQTAAFVVLMFSVNHSSRFSGFGVMTSAPGASNKEGRRVFCGPDGTSFPGKLFGVHWVTNCEVFFRDCEHILNAFNENKPVKVGRDGQEIHPDAGRQLCLLIDARQPPQSRPAPLCIQSLPLDPCVPRHRPALGTPSQQSSEALGETASAQTLHTASSASVAPSSELAQQLAAVAKFLKKQQPSEESSGDPENAPPNNTSPGGFGASIATEKSQLNSTPSQAADLADAGLLFENFTSSTTPPRNTLPDTFSWDFSWLEHHCESHPVYGIFPVDLTEMSSHQDYMAQYMRSQNLWQALRNALAPGTTFPPFPATVLQRLKALRDRSQPGPAALLPFHPTEPSSYMPPPPLSYSCGETEAFQSWAAGPWQYSPYGGPPEAPPLGCTPTLHPPLLSDCSTSEACGARDGRGHGGVHNGAYLQAASRIVETSSKKRGPHFAGDLNFPHPSPLARGPVTAGPLPSACNTADTPQSRTVMGHRRFFGAEGGTSPCFDADLFAGLPICDVQSGDYRSVAEERQRVLDTATFTAWDTCYAASSSSSNVRAPRVGLSRPVRDEGAAALEACDTNRNVSQSRSPHRKRPQLERDASVPRTLNDDDLRERNDGRRRRARGRAWGPRDAYPRVDDTSSMGRDTISTTYGNRGNGRRKILRVSEKERGHAPPHVLNAPLSARYQEDGPSEDWEWWKHVGASYKHNRKNAQPYYDPQNDRNPSEIVNSGQPKKSSTSIPPDSYHSDSQRDQPGSRSSPHVQHPTPKYTMKMRESLNYPNRALTTQYSY